MNTITKTIAAAALLCLPAMTGCDRTAATATPGDASADAEGDQAGAEAYSNDDSAHANAFDEDSAASASVHGDNAKAKATATDEPSDD